MRLCVFALIIVTTNQRRPTPRMTSLCFTSAVEIASKIRNREVSVCEVMQAHLDQIDRVNPSVNAVCTLLAEPAMEQAKRHDETLARDGDTGPLFGLPIAHKDLVATKGIRTTFGSPIYQDFVPDTETVMVERLRAAGAITIGKTNTPEFGAGSHTYNPVFGATCNPYDLTRSAGGSSGGAGAALACGMLPIADGSDLGGSLRNPGSFNNVVGFRPSPGRVPRTPAAQPWDTLSVLGPMGRSVADVALLLGVMAGPERRDPISISESPDKFFGSLEHDVKGTRIAWSPDLGMFQVEASVVSTIEEKLSHFNDLGCIVEQAHPDFSGAAEIFQVMRASGFAAGHAEELKQHRHLMKDAVIWNTEQGLKLSALDVARAQAERGLLFQRVHKFFEEYDFLLLPVAQVLPFPIEMDWVREINGVTMETYIDWMLSCSLVSLTERPAMSIPCGFSAEGLPVGLQIVGPHRGELAVLKLAHAFEQLTKVADNHPKIAV